MVVEKEEVERAVVKEEELVEEVARTRPGALRGGVAVEEALWGKEEEAGGGVAVEEDLWGKEEVTLEGGGVAVEALRRPLEGWRRGVVAMGTG